MCHFSIPRATSSEGMEAQRLRLERLTEGERFEVFAHRDREAMAGRVTFVMSIGEAGSAPDIVRGTPCRRT